MFKGFSPHEVRVLFRHSLNGDFEVNCQTNMCDKLMAMQVRVWKLSKLRLLPRMMLQYSTL